ncbi:hypothetical protein V6N13_057195 [Hibiscus sabdariffa]|uniref:Uncharacterized protein n=1 Tax=Hibiscus sabdariffa TaxID=183260 RepID=A0ABR2CV03_9ROSI
MHPVPLQVVPLVSNVVPENYSADAIHDDSGDAANFEPVTTNVVVFAVDPVGGPMHAVAAELNDWFDGNVDDADLVRCGPHQSLPVKRASGGSDSSKVKRP